jgi:hypothetical protein
MNNDFSIPPTLTVATDVTVLSQSSKVWYNRAGQLASNNNPVNSTSPFVVAPPTNSLNIVPSLPATVALPQSISLSDFIQVYTKILPPDGTVLTHQALATLNLEQYQLSTQELLILGALMGNEQLFKLVDAQTPSTLTIIPEGRTGVFRGTPSIQLKTGEVVTRQSAVAEGGTLNSVGKRNSPTPTPTPQPLIAQLPNKTIASFVPAVGFQKQPFINRTVENASLFAVNRNPPLVGGFATPSMASTATIVPLNLQQWLPYLPIMLARTTTLEAFRLLLVAQLYGHLPLETPEVRGESRDEALQRLAKVKEDQVMMAEAKAKRNPMDALIDPIEAILPAWLLNALNNNGMVDKKGAIHLKAGVLKNLYVRARNQYKHEDIKFEELLSLKPTNKEEQRHLRFLQEAEVFNLLAHMERGGDNQTMNLQDLEVAASRQVLHTHFGYEDDETIIIDQEA